MGGDLVVDWPNIVLKTLIGERLATIADKAASASSQRNSFDISPARRSNGGTFEQQRKSYEGSFLLI